MVYAQPTAQVPGALAEETERQRFERMEVLQQTVREGDDASYRQATQLCSTDDIGWYAEVRVELALKMLKKTRAFHMLNQIERTTRRGKQDSNGVDIYITFFGRSMRIPLQVKSSKKEKVSFDVTSRNKGDPIRAIMCPLSISHEQLLKKVEEVLRDIYKAHGMKVG